MNIAICDDNNEICSHIETVLLDYSRVHCIKIEVTVFYSGHSIINFLKHNIFFDLIYLDIEMESINGLEVGKFIRQDLKNYKTEIIYISGKNDYDRLLFDVQPLHFIPKPLIDSIIIDDLLLAIERSEKRTILFRYEKQMTKYAIPIDDILYFESIGRTIKIVMIGSEDIFYSTLGNIQTMLAEYSFLHIHRSYLVNYNHITRLTYSNATMSDGKIITIGRTKRNELRELQLKE